MLRLRTRSPFQVRYECAITGARNLPDVTGAQPTRSNFAEARDEPASQELPGIMERDGSTSVASDDGSVPVVVT